MTLYEIDQAILACIDMETGEIIDVDGLQALQMERTEKIDNVAKWIVNLQSDIVALDEQEKKFKARKDAAKKKVEGLKTWLSNALEGKKRETPEYAVTFRKSSRVDVADVEMLPAEYIREKVTREADKKAITEAIKRGEMVVGAELVETTSIGVK